MAKGGALSLANQAANAAAYGSEIASARDIFGTFLPQAAAKIKELAEGASYEAMRPNGDIVTLKLPPNLNANIYIMDRFLGKTRAGGAEILDRLNVARAVFMEEQVVKGLIETQIRELMSRAKLKEIETQMWPKQFVTEDQQQEQIQALAEALLTKLMSLTPDEYEAINEGKSSSEALEALKGKIGRELGEVVEEVMSKGEGEDADDEEPEEEEEAPEEEA